MDSSCSSASTLSSISCWADGTAPCCWRLGAAPAADAPCRLPRAAGSIVADKPSAAPGWLPCWNSQHPDGLVQWLLVVVMSQLQAGSDHLQWPPACSTAGCPVRTLFLRTTAPGTRDTTMAGPHRAWRWQQQHNSCCSCAQGAAVVVT